MSRFALRKKIRLPVISYDQGHTFFITIAAHQKYPWFSNYPELCEASVKRMNLYKILPVKSGKIRFAQKLLMKRGITRGLDRRFGRIGRTSIGKDNSNLALHVAAYAAERQGRGRDGVQGWL